MSTRLSRYSVLTFWLMLTALLVQVGITSCGRKEPSPSEPASIRPMSKMDGPTVPSNPFPHERGDAAAGRDVYRFETFGNEGFWTDAMRLPQGVLEAKFTPRSRH